MSEDFPRDVVYAGPLFEITAVLKDLRPLGPSAAFEESSVEAAVLDHLQQAYMQGMADFSIFVQSVHEDLLELFEEDVPRDVISEDFFCQVNFDLGYDGVLNPVYSLRDVDVGGTLFTFDLPDYSRMRPSDVERERKRFAALGKLSLDYSAGSSDDWSSFEEVNDVETRLADAEKELFEELGQDYVDRALLESNIRAYVERVQERTVGDRVAFFSKVALAQESLGRFVGSEEFQALGPLERSAVRAFYEQDTASLQSEAYELSIERVKEMTLRKIRNYAILTGQDGKVDWSSF